MNTKDTHGQASHEWIGVDLDGTLAEYHGWKGIDHIGVPIPKMVARVVKWVTEGTIVKILTARACPTGPDGDVEERKAHIQSWLATHVYPLCPVGCKEFEITNAKDYAMLELWDDRCVQVVPNTGERADGKEEVK